MLREEATVLTGMLIGLSAIDFRWGLGGRGHGGGLRLFLCEGPHSHPLIPAPNPVAALPPASA